MKQILPIILLVMSMIGCGGSSVSKLDQNPVVANELVETFYPSGALKTSFSTINDKKQGTFNVYFEDGALLKSTQWNDGKQVGTQVEFDYKQGLIYKKYFDVDSIREEVHPLIVVDDSSILGAFSNAIAARAKDAVTKYGGTHLDSLLDLSTQAKEEFVSRISEFLEDEDLYEILSSHQQGVEYSGAFAKGVDAGVVQIYEEYEALLGADFYKVYQELIDPETWEALAYELNQATLNDARQLVEKAMHGYVEDFEERYEKYGIEIDQRVYFNSGYLATEYVASLLAGKLALKIIPSHSSYKITHVKTRSHAVKARVNSRLPRNDGHWNGVAGESKWQSYKPKVLRVTRGRPVRFYRERPDFSPWSKGTFNYKQGMLKGDHKDFGMVKNTIKDKYKFRTQDDVQKWLDKENLTIHHVDTKQVQLVPSDLHNNIPHVGGAAEARVMN